MKKTVFLLFLLFLFLVLPFPSVTTSPDGWVNPDSHVDDSGKWVNEVKAYDDNTGTCAYAGSYFEESTGYLYLNLDSAITSDKVRYNVVEEYCTDIVIEIGYTNGSWIEIYRSDAWLPANTWKNLTFEEDTVNSTRIIANLHGSLFPMIYSCLYVYEVDFWEIEEAPPTEFELNLNSLPFQNVNFTLNGTTYQTNYTDTLNESYYNITFPSVWVNNSITYIFKNWSDGLTDPSRIINLNANTTLTVTYVLPSKIHVLFVGASVVFGIIGFVFILSRKKKR